MPEYPPRSLCTPLSPHLEAVVEEMYSDAVQKCGARFSVFAPGSLEPQRVAAPSSFAALLEWLESGWSLPTWDREHPVVRLLGSIAERAPLRIDTDRVVIHNRRAVYLAYAFLSKRLATAELEPRIEAHAEALTALLQDPELQITWSDDGQILRLGGGDRKLEIAVDVHVHGSSSVEQHHRVPVSSTVADPPAAWSVRHRGKLELIDNALGQISTIFVLHNRFLPEKTLRAIGRAFTCDLVVATLPQTEQLHYLDQIVQTLRQHKWEPALVEQLRRAEKQASAHLQAQLDAACRQAQANPFALPLKDAVQRWETLHDQLLVELVPGHAAALRQRLVESGIAPERLTVLTTDAVTTRWARDHFVLARSPTGQAIIAGSTLQAHERHAGIGRALAELPALTSAWQWFDLRVPFEGGDLRAVGPELLVGKNTFAAAVDEVRRRAARGSVGKVGTKPLRTKKRPGIEQHVRDELQALFGRSVVVVGEGQDSAQPIMHLDMFLTVLPSADPRGIIVLADTDETVAILEGLDAEERAQTERAMLCASLEPAELGDRSAFWLYRGTFMEHDLVRALRHVGLRRYVRVYRESPQRRLLQERLDAVGQWLVQRGYEVHRAPTAAQALNYFSFWQTRRGGVQLCTLVDKAQRVYNNGLVEVYEDESGQLVQRVVLPSYGLWAIERRLAEIYGRLGYSTTFVPFMWEPAFGSGGLDCITSEYRRPFRA